MLPQKLNQKEISISYQGHNFLLKISHGQEVNLTDLWQAIGAPVGKETWRWLEQDGARQFIDIFCDSKNLARKEVLRTARGKGGGTWAHWQIALAYAKYLSPEFHMAINQVFKERLEEIQDPELGITRSRQRAIRSYERRGKDSQWIQERLLGIEQRNYFTDTLKDHRVEGNGYAACTDEIYKGTFGADTKELRNKLEIPKGSNVRDRMNNVGLAAIRLAEAIAEEKIEQEKHYGNNSCKKVCGDAGHSVRQSLISAQVSGVKSIIPS